MPPVNPKNMSTFLLDLLFLFKGEDLATSGYLRLLFERIYFQYTEKSLKQREVKAKTMSSIHQDGVLP